MVRHRADGRRDGRKVRRAVRYEKHPYTVVTKSGWWLRLCVERSVWTPDPTAAGVALAGAEWRWGAGGDCNASGLDDKGQDWSRERITRYETTQVLFQMCV